MASSPLVLAVVACVVAWSMPAPASGAFPSWVLTPASTAGLQTANYNFTWAKVVEQYAIYALEDSPDVLSNPNADYCQDGQQPFGIFFGRQRPQVQNCTINAAKYQYAVYPVGTYFYYQFDNVDPRFASPLTALQTCSLNPVDTPADDTLVLAINGQVVDNTTGATAQQTLATTPLVTLPVPIGNDTAGGVNVINNFMMYLPDFPNPSNRSIQALVPSLATQNNPTLAAPVDPSMPYPDHYVFNAFLGTHFIAVDLAKAPANFSLSIVDWVWTFDNTKRATADTCALCGLCPPSLPCPYNTTAFPDNPPDICSLQLNSEFQIDRDGQGPFTWNTKVVTSPVNSA